jgi:hypothetical protein
MANVSNNPKRVIFIGAAGEMGRLAVEYFAKASTAPLVLTDINETATQQLASKLPPGRATSKKLNLFEPTELLNTIQGAALVVLGAGPYSRTSEPVLKACLDAKVPYLDFDDDVESTQAALDLHEEAKRSGVPCYIGCGASPGMSNVMAVDAARSLDTVDTIDICWLVGDEHSVGKAVLEHLMHIAAGPCLTWADGKAAINESWVETAYAPIIPGGGETLLHETAHPEPVTLPRLYPKATRIRCLGGMDPAPVNGIARGLGVAVRSQAIPMDAAVSFMVNLAAKNTSAGGWGGAWSAVSQHLRGGDITLNQLMQLASHTTEALTPWSYAIWGIIDQIRSGECTATGVLQFFIDAARGKYAPYRSGLLIRAVGTRNGHPAVAIRRTPSTGPDSFLGKSMGAITGASCAAFMVMAIEGGDTKQGGVFCPEDWAEPGAFYKALERLGCPADDIVETLHG